MAGKSSGSYFLYHNCTVYHPTTGLIMFRCDQPRMKWYLESGLAELVQQDPPAIRLTFTPRGPGHLQDPYFLQDFKNRCVVCGSEENLSHHHVVPYAYRRHFSRESYRYGRWMYDVLLNCLGCHERYEKQANELKIEIAGEHGVPIEGVPNVTPDQIRAAKLACTVFKHGHKMPPERRAQMETELKKLLGKDELDGDDLLFWYGFRHRVLVTPAGELIAPNIKDIDDFAIRWRKHYLRHMKPKFLPQGWDPERRIYSEKERA
jgi:hypothetical protein